MKLKLNLTVFFLFWGLIVFSQTSGLARGAYSDIINPDIINSRVYDSYKGSPYSSDDFSAAIVVLKNGEKVNFDKVKIDFYANLIIFIQDGAELALDNEIVSEVHFPNQPFSDYRKITFNGEDKFLQLMVDGSKPLLKLTDMALVLENRQSASGYSGNTDINQKVFKSKIRYFIINENTTLMEVPLSEKEFLNTFSNISNDLDAFLKSEKIKLKKEDDLIKVFNKINLN
jgi:hypothetical protein